MSTLQAPMPSRRAFTALLVMSFPFKCAWATPAPRVTGEGLARAAKAQIGKTLFYDSGYRPMAYPNGDVPLLRGVCTDVVVRAYRAFEVDLQVLVHRDMSSAWSAYPKLWGLRAPDRNIDHRRVPNLAVFFRRHGQSFPVSKRPENFLPGDIVTWRLRSGAPHIGVVADAKSRGGTPLIVHNIGWGTRMDDMLFDHPLTGHYRYGGPAARGG